MQVEGQHEVCLQTLMATGARVSNAYRTSRILGDSLLKGRLIPDGFLSAHAIKIKEFRYAMGMRPIR